MIHKWYKPALALLLLASLGRLQAQDDEWKPTAGAAYASERVFRGVERSGDAAQASVELAGYHFRGSVWTSQPFKAGEPGETDLSAGCAFQMPGQLVLEAKVTQFVYAQAAPGATRQSTEAGLQVSWSDRSGLAASLACFRDFRLEADTLQVTAGYSLALKHIGTYLELNFFAGWVNGSNVLPDAPGPRVRNAYTYYGADARLPYRLGGHTTLVGGLHFSDTIGQSRSWSPVNVPGGARVWVDFAVNFDF